MGQAHLVSALRTIMPSRRQTSFERELASASTRSLRRVCRTRIAKLDDKRIDELSD